MPHIWASKSLVFLLPTEYIRGCYSTKSVQNRKSDLSSPTTFDKSQTVHILLSLIYKSNFFFNTVLLDWTQDGDLHYIRALW